MRSLKMQQIKKTIYEKSCIGIVGTAWISGLLIAGSDSLYMPWFNGMGLVLFFGASILLGKLLNPSQSNYSIMLFHKFYQKPSPNVMESKKKNRRINIRYALGI
jgi:hypothetical protein